MTFHWLLQRLSLIYYSYGEWVNKVKPNDQGGECWVDLLDLTNARKGQIYNVK
jgi:hypothetical protein